MNQDHLAGADVYTSCDDLGIVTAYFNPCHYRTRWENYQVFANSMRRSGLRLLTVECAFGDDAFELEPSPAVIQVRSADVLWQKERLLNLGIARLPQSVRKVAWIDGDVLFSNADWAVEASRRLEDMQVVQLFDTAIRLERGQQVYDGVSRRYVGTIAARDQPGAPHGHPGFAWAARRDLLVNHGLYDVAFDVEADHVMAHAFSAELDSNCIHRATGLNVVSEVTHHYRKVRWIQALRAVLRQTYRRWIGRRWAVRRVNLAFKTHFMAWAGPCAAEAQGKVGYVPGVALHLWHGDVTAREAAPIRRALHRHGFDPARDVRIGASGCWEWATPNPELRALSLELFRRRQEDGDDAVVA